MLLCVICICNDYVSFHDFNLLLCVTLRVTNEIQMHPLTVDTYSNQWVSLTLTMSDTTMFITDNTRILSLVYSSIFQTFNSC